MSDFSVTILGCGSAKPTLRHYTSSQVVSHRGNLFLVDCCEGIQRCLLRNGISMAKIGHIFISHLHGDHCLGLVGLISTLGLGQRTGKIVIHAHEDAEKIFKPLFEYFCPQLSMEVEFAPFDTTKSEIIYEDRSLIVRTIPLHHRMPCAGFLFEEKPNPRHINSDKCKEIGIPKAYLSGIALGNNWTTEDGTIIENKELTFEATPSKSYAYCSDTLYSESIVPIISNCDLLYHEATYLEDKIKEAKDRGHSTAKQAATIAKLSNAKKLIIGHYSARYGEEGEIMMLNEAKAVFENTELAREKLVLEL